MAKEKLPRENDSMMRPVFGFDLSDFNSWTSFVKLMMRPEDPASLAVFRILFGFVMIIDIPNERGMSQADIEYGDKDQCIFPLFDFLAPLAPEWMVIIYAIMFIGAFGIMVGLKYRLSCLLFLVPYWYLFFLDKTTWNNHSYLYGLIGFQLFLYDANRCYSIDALLDKSIRNSHVPLWNYCILRTQVIMVYFLAGLKKIDADWISGYSMSSLGTHWVFDPFRIFLTSDQITLFIVHICGLILDLSVGFLMFFDKTRFLGTLMSSSFHIMNSRMFNIGMFPYTMLATTTIFYSNDWPKRLAVKLGLWSNAVRDKSGSFVISIRSAHCIYEKTDKNEDDNDDYGDDDNKKSNTRKQRKSTTKSTTTKTKFYHKFFTIFTLLYLAEQTFLPYSHFITKGYNNWTNGLYGYSWDMMVHSWHTQHIKVYFVDKKTNKTQYINPKAWTSRRRWSSHADMIYQYSRCIKERLHKFGYDEIELYMDIWRSMNHRFNQRQIDPRVNLLEARWSPFEETPWLIPLMTELSDWRSKMKEIENRFQDKDYDLTFVADLPGLRLENYVSEFLNSTVEVLNGRINLEVEYFEEKQVKTSNHRAENQTTEVKKVLKKKNHTLEVGDKMDIPSGVYHNIYTVSDEPSCFLYFYLNETAIFLSDLYSNFHENMMWTFNRTFETIESEHSQNQGETTPREELMWKAYNETLLENSKSFPTMIALNRSDDKQDYNATIQSIKKFFNARKINQTRVYYEFVNKFYSDFEHRTIKGSYSKLEKIYKKIRSEFFKFKISFHMVYLALRSIFTREDFIKLVESET